MVTNTCFILAALSRLSPGKQCLLAQVVLTLNANVGTTTITTAATTTIAKRKTNKTLH